MLDPAIPVDVDDVTPEWLGAALGAGVTGVEVLDRHSGTTGRARVGVTYAAGDDGAFPPSLFVKLPPFDEAQRKFVDMAGLGVAEALFYRDLAQEIVLRIPAVHYAAVDDDGRYVMVIEDLAAVGCRFPRPGDDDVAEWGGSLVEELARLHAPFWDSPRLQQGGDLVWVTNGGRTGRNVPKGSGGGYIGLALEQFGDEMGSAFRRLAELYMANAARIMEDVLDEGTPTLIHGDPHLGNLFIDGTKVGFLDWAMLDRRTGMRDVSYVLCNSIPAEIRRGHEKEWVARYLATLAEGGVVLDADTAWEQYRLYATYSWVSATSTAAVGNRWQAAKIGQGGMRRATASIEDLDTVTILEDRLGV
ncbi:MAG: phosphotransferase [Acidimicrobiia bacterium]